MKKIILLLSLLVVASFGVAQAQSKCKQKCNPDEWSKKDSKALGKKLALTADQQSKVDAILEDRAKQVKDVHAANADEQATKDQHKAIMDASNAKIRAVLNDGQKQKFDVWAKEKTTKCEKKMMKK